jgi:hypothetical protein
VFFGELAEIVLGGKAAVGGLIKARWSLWFVEELVFFYSIVAHLGFEFLTTVLDV